MPKTLPPLEIAFRVNGLDQVKAAFKSVQDAVVSAEKAMNQATQAGVKTRSNAYADEAKWKASLAKQATDVMGKAVEAQTKKELAELDKRTKAHAEHAKRVSALYGSRSPHADKATRFGL